MAGLLLPLAMLALGADPKEVPTELKGTWQVYSSGSGIGVMTYAKGPVLTIDDGTIAWQGVVPGLGNDGKARIKVDAKSNPGHIEVTAGEKVFKGIYRVFKKEDGRTGIELLFGEDGEAAPKKFYADNIMPATFKGWWVSGIRE